MMPRRPLLVIAHATVIEAVGNRLIWLNAGFLLAAVLAAQFIGAIAITETRGFQAGLLGAGLRVYAVAMLSVFVVTSLVREFNDKGHQLLLSLAIGRWVYLLGKWIGFTQVGALTALAFAIVLAYYAPWEAALFWGLSLGCELALIAALGLLCVLTFAHVTLALCVVGAFYFTARTIHTLLLMTSGPFAQTDTAFNWFSEQFLRGLAYLVPDLTPFGASEWLVHGVGAWSALGQVAGQAGIYTVLLLAAAAFDLYRKNW